MKRVLITGGSGFIGRKLVHELLRRGDLVTVLSRDVQKARSRLPRAVRVAHWDPRREGPWFEELDVVDAVIHLAGETLLKRWTERTKREIEASRVESTRLLVEAISKTKHKPGVLLSASAIGIYGPRDPGIELDESSVPGKDYLASVVTKWEAAARDVERFGVRSVQVRLGVVLGEGGGALQQMMKPFKMYAGGPIGSGQQVISWVHADDVAGIFLLALDNEELRGPINATSPNPATSEELADALGIVLNRPNWFRTPESLLRIRFGEAASVLTTGQRVVPRRAADLGYEFHHARLIPALESIVADS